MKTNKIQCHWQIDEFMPFGARCLGYSRHTEMEDVMARSLSGVNGDADIMVLNKNEFWMTWDNGMTRRFTRINVCFYLDIST